MIKEGNRTVLEAAMWRIEYIFSKKNNIHFSFSGGKESLVISTIIIDLIKAKKIDPSKLIVSFIDEEGMYPCIIEIIKEWKLSFEKYHVRFDWYCMEFLHFNCLDSLYQEETWKLWDKSKKENWIREMPDGAITNHPIFKEGMKYQDFTDKLNKDKIDIIGLRAFESIQRRQIFLNKSFPLVHNKYYPIFDWTLNDVWLFHLKRNTKLPDAYMYQWKSGIGSNKLRISQFFSIDTVGSLVNMSKYYPGLFQRILKRSENAELALLYYDSAMFRKNTATRKKTEKGTAGGIDWRKKTDRVIQKGYQEKWRFYHGASEEFLYTFWRYNE